MRTRHWFWLLLVTGILLLVLAKYVYSIEAQMDKVITTYQDRLQQDKATIENYFANNKSSNLKSVDDSPYYIEIYSGDSIHYWNRGISTNSHNLLSISQIGKYPSYANVFLSLDAHQKLVTDDYILTTTSNKGHKLGNTEFKVEIIKNSQLNTILNIGWLCLFGAWILSTLIWRHKINSSLIYGALILFGFKVTHEFNAFRLLFEGSWMIKIVDKATFLKISYADILIYLWLLVMFAYYIRSEDIFARLSARVRKFPLLAWFVSGGLTTLIFGVWSSITYLFVTSDHIHIDTQDLLSLDVAGVGIIFAMCIMVFIVYHITFSTAEILVNSRQKGITPYAMMGLGIVAVAAIMALTGFLQVSVWMFVAYVLAYMLIMDAYIDNKSPKITYLIWWMIMYAGFIAINLYHHSVKRDIINRDKFVKELYNPADLKITNSLENIQESLLNSTSIFTNITSLTLPAKIDNKDLDQFIFENISIQVPHLQRSIELFDSRGNTLFSNHFANFSKTTQLWQNAEKVGKNIYYNAFESKYIIRIEILQSDVTKSWILFIIYNEIDSTNKKLSKAKSNYNYIVFGPESIIERRHNSEEPTVNPAAIVNLDASTIKDGYSYAVANPNKLYKIISYKKNEGLIKPISMFSFIFTFLGLITLLLSTINTRYEFLPDHIPLKFGSRSSLKSKIQLAIIFLILFTFLVIGMITIYYFKNLIEVNQITKHKEESSSLVQNINSDVQNMESEAAITFLQTKINEYAYIHDKDLALYDASGKIIISTREDSSPQRIPMYYLKSNTQRPKEENIDYLPLFINDENPYGYISVGHRSLELTGKSIFDFLSTILNAYIFLFLIAGAIAITIANSITQPLSFLTDKLKKFKLGQANEPLQWQSKDEIGTLIDDYNNLTQEVERSAHVLAKTQRDMAWREMAKQVAHEIKNPLTPMKLSIQYLDRATSEDPTKAKEMITRISSTLIEQIDNLTQIANEFSNFATMPKAANEKIVLNEIVEAVHDLFRKRDDMDISLSVPIDDLIVFADRNHLVRILNNLLKNAIQAIPDSRRGKIDIELKRLGGEALIRVSDNGTGIADEMRDKVFTPNFTTKSSGTGLGLAISANMIESFNGRIYFDTRPGIGTDFYISIPLMRLDDYIDTDEDEDNDSQLERVSLDD